MSPVDADRFRGVLTERRERVAHAIAALHERHSESIEDETDEETYDTHMADVATETFNRELDQTLEENDEHVLAAIDAALERIDAGTYGVCTSCGREIGEERLEAIPYAALCIDCQRRQERG